MNVGELVDCMGNLPTDTDVIAFVGGEEFSIDDVDYSGPVTLIIGGEIRKSKGDSSE